MPAASLPALENHLEARLLELEKLHQTRPSLPTALDRARAGQRIDELLDEIAELQRLIDTSPAEALEDAAVKLRRLDPKWGRGKEAKATSLSALLDKFSVTNGDARERSGPAVGPREDVHVL